MADPLDFTTRVDIHTLKFVTPGVSSDHWSPIDVLLTLAADTLRPTAIQQNYNHHSKSYSSICLTHELV